MIITVEGTKSFSDYDIFMRAMAVAMSSKPTDIQVWSLGPHKINSFTAGFCNLTTRYLKGVGTKIRFFNVSYDWVKQNADHIDYFAFFSTPNEPLSKFTKWLQSEKENVEIGVFRY